MTVDEAPEGTCADEAGSDRALRRAIRLERLAALRALPAPARAALALRRAEPARDGRRARGRADGIPGQRTGRSGA